MKQKVHAGMVLETATPEEVKMALDVSNTEWFRERARGVMTWRFESEPETVAGTAVKIPGNGQLKCGPNPGFCVMVHKLRISGLSSGDVVSVYRNSVNSVPVEQFVMPATGTLDVINPGSKGLFLASDDRLIFSGTGLMATGDVLVSAEGTECPAPDAWKLIS